MHYKQYQQIQMRKNRCCLSIALLLSAGFESRGLAFFKSKYCNNNQRMSWQSHNEHHDETKHPIFCCSVCVFFYCWHEMYFGAPSIFSKSKISPHFKKLADAEQWVLLFDLSSKKQKKNFKIRRQIRQLI